VRHHVIAAAVVAALAALVSAPASAQDSNFALSPANQSVVTTPGWTLTPTLLYQTAWDDNVFLRSTGDQAPSDLLNILNPRAGVGYTSHRTQFDANYDGAFIFYRDNSPLDSYDQHGSVSVRRMVTPHVSLFAMDSGALVPTTELVQFIAVPFVRTGSRIESFRGGVEAALTKFTSISVAYDFEWVDFDRSQAFSEFLRGGHSHGGTFGLKHGITSTTTLTGDYSIQHALVLGGAFDVQNGSVGIDQRLSDETHVFGALGISRVEATDIGPSRTGPAVRAGITHRLQHVNLGADYSRSYVPAFGFGGTYQNEEISGHVSAPLARRIYVQGTVSWRRNDPLTATELQVRSWWSEAILGYAVQPWIRIEGFYSGTNQTTSIPGVAFDRNRVGVQVVTAKPMRIR